MTQPIGFIGLGNLGTAMAKRLADQGNSLVLWNRTPGKAEALIATLPAPNSHSVATHPADLVSKCEIVILNLFDTEAVKQVVAGVNGIFESDCRGKIIIDTTTNHFSEVATVYGLIEDAGGKYLEAPVLGSVVPALQGNLTILVSGDKRSYENSKPLLDQLAKAIFYLEERTLATRIKLLNNLVLGSIMGAIAEAVSIGEVSGIDRARLLEILAAGAGNSAVMNAKRQKLIDGDYSPQFSVGAIHKDLEYLKQMATSMKLEPVMAEAVRRIFNKADKAGDRDLDLSAVIKSMSKGH
jgi:3-hydroxyisobutyrate dehydrogenase